MCNKTKEDLQKLRDGMAILNGRCDALKGRMFELEKAAMNTKPRMTISYRDFKHGNDHLRAEYLSGLWGSWVEDANAMPKQQVNVLHEDILRMLLEHLGLEAHYKAEKVELINTTTTKGKK